MNTLSIVANLLSLVALVFHILIIVKMFQNGQTGLGVACIIGTFCLFGWIITLIYAWTKGREWNISQGVAIGYTATFLLSVILGTIGAFQTMGDVQRQLQNQPGRP